jgi:hypothetical protein
VDGHVGRSAARAKDMAASEIRALFAVAARPELVSPTGGMPCVTEVSVGVIDLGGGPEALPPVAQCYSGVFSRGKGRVTLCRECAYRLGSA